MSVAFDDDPPAIQVRLFGVVREHAGRDSVAVPVPVAACADDVVAAALEQVGGEALRRLPVRLAVNRRIARGDQPVAAGDELALIPPVSGGCVTGSEIHVAIRSSPLDVASVRRTVGRPGAGAVVTFEGTTRDVAWLEYEAYTEMAQERIAEILRLCQVRHGLDAIAAEHRVGVVPLGETSVVVVAAAAHRGEAFAGARDAIDAIKEQVPIWKREFDTGADGEEGRWVAGVAPGADSSTGSAEPPIAAA